MASGGGLLGIGLIGLGIAAIVAAPFSGGASLYLYGAGAAALLGGTVLGAGAEQPDAVSQVHRQTSSTTDPEAPWETVYGTVVKGAAMPWTGVGGSEDEFTGFDYVIASHPCEEILEIQLGEWCFPITTDPAGSDNYNGRGLILNTGQAYTDHYPADWYVCVQSSPWFRRPQDDKNTDANAHIGIKINLGNQTTTDSFMASRFGTAYSGVARKFIGHSVIHLITRVNSELGSGGPQEFLVRLKGKNDIQDHNGANPQWRDNTALIFADYCRDTFNLPVTDIVNLSSAATECDDTTWSGASGDKRYRFDGVIRDDMEPTEALDLIASHMCGGYYERGDKVGIWTGTVKTGWADGPITYDDLAGDDAIQVNSPDEDRWVNTVASHFVVQRPVDEDGFRYLHGLMEPAKQEVTSSTYVTEDGGVVLRQDMKWPACILGRRAKFMSWIMLKQMRLGNSLHLRLKKRAIVLEPGDVFDTNLPDFFPNGTNWQVTSKRMVLGPDTFAVEIDAVRYNDAIYTPDTTPTEDLVGIVGRGRSTILPAITGLDAAPAPDSSEVNARGQIIVSSIVSWDLVPNILVRNTGHIRIQRKLESGGNWSGFTAAGDDIQTVIPGWRQGLTYSVRARAEGMPSAGRAEPPVGPWTDPITYIPDTSYFVPEGPQGSNLLSDPLFVLPYDSGDGDGAKLGGYVTTDAGGSNAVTGSAEVITGVGYWSVVRDGVTVLTALRMTINGDAGDSARLNVLEFIPVTPGQILQVGCSLTFGSTGKIRVQMLLYDEDRAFIANSSRVVIDQEAGGKTPGQWYHRSAPYQVQPVGGVLPSFVRYQFRQIRYAAFGSAEAISIDGLILRRLQRARAPYDPDDEETIDGTSVGSNYQFILSFGLPKSPQGGPFYANGDQEFQFEFTCDAQVAVAATTSAGPKTTWAEFRMMLVDGTYANWQPNTAYVIGDRVRNRSSGSVLDRTYQCDTNGTSAGSGGPTGTGTNITDGTTRWDYVEDTPQVLISKSPNKPYSRLVTASGDTTAVKSNWSPVRLHPSYTPAAGFWIIRPQVRLTPAADDGDPDHTKVIVRDIRLSYEIIENEFEAAPE